MHSTLETESGEEARCADLGKCSFHDTTKWQVREPAAKAGFGSRRKKLKAQLCFIINNGEAE